MDILVPDMIHSVLGMTLFICALRFCGVNEVVLLFVFNGILGN
jgi:hypothetical protein